MPGILDACRSFYGTDKLYELLEIDKEATSNQVKRAYHKLSLKVHPDRVDPSEKEDATRKFQILGKVYSILSDKDKRALYDESGEIDEEDDALTQDKDWYEYWRLLFAKISVTDIKEFEDKYKGSQEELNDLKSAYIESEGNMEEILDNVMCSMADDEERFRSLIQQAVDDGDLPEYDSFTQECPKQKKNRKRKAAKEAKEAEGMKKELGIGENDSLRSLIAARQQSREQQMDGFFSHLEQKYAQPKSKGKGKKGKS